MIKYKRTLRLKKLPAPLYLSLRKARRKMEELSLGRRVEKYSRSLYEKYGDKPPIFSSIEVETINRCNNDCAFCPVNRNAEVREFKKMDVELFDKILADLKALNYKGRFNLYSNNEPFMDNRITDFAKKAKAALPEACIGIFTNGLLLTLDMFKEIIPYLDKMGINNYNDELEFNETTQIIHDYCQENPDCDRKVSIFLRKKTEIMSTRGGNSPNNKKRKTINTTCLLPFRQMVVRPDGKVSLCCNDARGEMTLGDVGKQSMAEIWHSDEYVRIRENIRKGRQYIPVCRFCDFITFVE